MPYEASPLLQFIRRLAPPHSVREGSDGHLLERFVAAKDEAAFEGLLHRHGQMVWAVCRRVLSSPQDVEDAFQAIFLVLVQKADSMRKQESNRRMVVRSCPQSGRAIASEGGQRGPLRRPSRGNPRCRHRERRREETSRVARCTKCSICSS